MNALISTLEQAVAEGKLLPASLENIQLLMRGTQDPVVPATIGELVDKGEWTELNNRFYNLEEAGGGDQHLFLSPAGAYAFDLTLVDGVIQWGPRPLRAVINGEVKPWPSR